jgi:O-antigen ligase
MTRNQTFLLLNALSVLGFFYSISFLSYTIALYFFVSLVFFFKEKLYKLITSTALLNVSLVVIPVFVLLISMVWTENAAEGWSQIAKRIPLISLPFCLWVQNRLTKKEISVKAINVWVLASTLFSLYGLFTIFIGYKIDYSTDLTFIHIRHLLHNEVLFMHPVYIGLASGITCLISFNKIVQKQRSYEFLFSVAFLINAVLLLLISARMPILATVICCLAILKFNIKALIFSAVFVIAFLLITPKVFPGYRFNEIIQFAQTLNNANGSTNNTLSTRQKIYSCSIKLIGDKPLLGHGIGDSVDAIQGCQLMQSEEGRLNSHNQFLEYLLATGIFGLCLFIAYLLSLLKSMRRRDSTFEVVLLAYFLLNMITENIFARTWGVFLFSYFLFMFYFHTPLIRTPKIR